MSFPCKKCDDSKNILIIIGKYIVTAINLDKNPIRYISLAILNINKYLLEYIWWTKMHYFYQQ